MTHIKNNPLQKYSYKSWNIRMVFAAFFMLLSLASINYFIDPYQIFHSNSFLPSSTSNERYNKIEYLLKRKNKYNAFLLGSSRMGIFNPLWFNHKKTHYYNLSVFSGDAKDNLKMLMLLKRQAVAIKEVVIGIDLFPFIEKNRTRPASLQPHPLISRTSYPVYYLRHLFSSSLVQSYLKIQQHYGRRSFTFNYTTGQWSLQALDQWRKKNPKKYKRKFFNSSLRAPMTVAFQEKRFLNLQELIDWLNLNNVKARYFIHPFSQLHQQRFSPETFSRLRQRIKTMIPIVHDFSTRTHWTNDSKNYYEKTHYRTRLARRIAAELISN